jgi:hypothetical protein
MTRPLHASRAACGTTQFREPDPLASSVNFNLRDVLNRSEEPG